MVALAVGVSLFRLIPARADEPNGATRGEAEGTEPDNLGDLDLEELVRVRIVTATLTPTFARLIPAKTTALDEATVARSGARTLDELLEISAANTQLTLHNTHLSHFGIRGIMSDRDDKYLLRVNGKTMNNRYFAGAESERDLPLLGDFRTVGMVHGAASATYGAGALAGVINLETHNGLTYEGADVQTRLGFMDRFTATEVRFGRKLGARSGLFLYAGFADQPGADQAESPSVFGKSFTTPAPTPTDVVSGQPVPFNVPSLHASGGLLKLKFHASYVNGPVELWARYTQGGGLVRPQRSVLQAADLADAEKGHRSVSQQLTVGAKLTQPLLDTLDLEAFISYGQYLYRLWFYDVYPTSDDRLEQEASGRVLLTWRPTPKHAAALGLEYSHMWFSGASASALVVGEPPAQDRWQTDTLSLLGEHQWMLSGQWTTFVSLRVDKHTYTDWLVSPRLALLFTPTPQDTLKLIAARAQRRSGDAELRQGVVLSGSHGATESLYSLELRYERQQDEHWSLGASGFLEQNDAIGYSSVVNHSIPVGTFVIAGVEPEVAFHAARSRIMLSHGYTQLLSARLATPTTIQGITAAPYGYGHDLANWANNITKLMVSHELNAEWSASTSLRVYWGFPGAKALADWNGSRSSPLNYALADSGYTAAYGPSVYWNLGVEYHPAKPLTLRLDAFNVIGWFDKTLNKRIYYFRGSDYSVEAAALALSVKLAI